MIILYITLLKMVDKIRCSDIVSLLLSSYDDDRFRLHDLLKKSELLTITV